MPKKGMPVPLFFWPALIFVSALALFGVDLQSNIAVACAAVVMLIGGLPHGAFDMALAQRTLRLKRREALAVLCAYLGVAAFMVALWGIAPLAALCLFLAFSAVHFGDDWRMIESGLLRSMAGASVLCVAAFAHPDMVSDLFILMAGPEAEWVRRVLVALTPVALLTSCVGVLQAASSGNRGWALAHSAALVGLAVFPPQIGFVLYFVFLHSPLHLRAVPESLATWSKARLWIYGGAICGVSLAAAYSVTPGLFSGYAPDMASGAFILLSVVAAPHLLLSHYLEEIKLRALPLS